MRSLGRPEQRHTVLGLRHFLHISLADHERLRSSFRFTLFAALEAIFSRSSGSKELISVCFGLVYPIAAHTLATISVLKMSKHPCMLTTPKISWNLISPLFQDRISVTTSSSIALSDRCWSVCISTMGISLPPDVVATFYSDVRS
mmetsp:Transcript_16472/g.25710  ORF Transcript_16472/g.25710 Transcript_16472/m.25710 type:complete len:145 (+) Transcript_16472:3357-3791(+)